LVSRYRLPDSATDQLAALLDALAAEPDPPTTVRSPPEALDAHLADSLSGLEVAGLGRAGSVADVGSGAGFPGLPLAIALPSTSFTLLEASRRKCEVVERLAAAAGVRNAHALPLRAEEHGAAEGREAYDAVTVRAVDSLAVLVEYAAPLLRVGGALVAWKGARDGSEEQAGSDAAAVLGMEPREVVRVRPFEKARDRHLHVYEKVAPTPEGFPRRPGMARKRPFGGEPSGSDRTGG
jgi:16S rRNA (guanine527-N7)-methyltransferase